MHSGKFDSLSFQKYKIWHGEWVCSLHQIYNPTRAIKTFSCSLFLFARRLCTHHAYAIFVIIVHLFRHCASPDWPGLSQLKNLAAFARYMHKFFGGRRRSELDFVCCCEIAGCLLACMHACMHARASQIGAAAKAVGLLATEGMSIAELAEMRPKSRPKFWKYGGGTANHQM